MTTENWAADFAESTGYATLDAPLKEHAMAICEAFLHAACDHPEIAPSEINEDAVRHAMLDHMPEVDVPEEIRPRLPEIIAAFLGSLEEAGRLAGGRTLGLQATALSQAYRERCKPGGGLRVPPIRNAAPKISRNDPCPCGSGKKYKKCCG